MGYPLSEVLDSYKKYLEVNYPQHFTKLEIREKSNRGGVILEAAMFSVLRSYGFKITIGEIIGEGGADFIIGYNKHEFVLEVTHLDKDAVERQSGMKNIVEDGEVGWFSMITHVLRRKASEKAGQVSGYRMPRVVCIGTTHSGAQVLLGKVAAKWLLTSETKIAVPIGDTEGKSYEATSLENSVFFKFDTDQRIIPCRRSISAVLLVGLFHDSCSAVGLLHPEPAFTFNIDLLPNIPFLRISNWPFSDGEIKTEWIISNPDEKLISLQKIEFLDEELRKL